ncbi:MAG TPA: SPFH domain-containing protein [Longimicrobiales bacterium]|nr:SPFH domain-containing protein [Longimicrobiales bacterium]
MDVQIGLIIGGVVLAALLALVATISALIVIVPPNTAAIITGRRRRIESGDAVGYRVVVGGRTLRVPIVESVDWMPLDTIPLEIGVTNAFSKGGIPLAVQAVANVKVASQPDSVFNNAVERLLGKPMVEIEGLARETLAANLRGVLATLTPEEVNEDRLRFAQELTEEAHQDLQKLGLQLDTLKIQNVSDDVGYLEAIGRVRTADIIKQAEVAEAEREAETMQRQATAREAAKTAEARADIAIAEAQNALRVRNAELMREAEIAERVAKADAERAEVEAQQELENQRIELQRRRLRADVVEPAEAARAAAIAKAQADASPILESGRAQAEALRLLYEEVTKAGPDGFAVLLAEKLPALLETTVEAVRGISIDKIVVLDDGSGTGVGNAANQRVGAALRTLEGLGSSLGIDISEILKRSVGGHGRGAGRAVPSRDEGPGGGGGRRGGNARKGAGMVVAEPESGGGANESAPGAREAGGARGGRAEGDATSPEEWTALPDGTRISFGDGA